MAFEPINGPIPGENYLADTKNFPWHRPPEITDLDTAIEESLKKLTSEDGSIGVLTMLEMGVDVATLTDIFVTKGIGAGKWTPDFAILLAGPISHIIVLMAKGYGIDYDLGIEDKKIRATKPLFEELKKINKNKAVEVGEEVQGQLATIQEKSKSGFMSATPPSKEEVI